MKLEPNNHVHKVALSHFLQAVENFLYKNVPASLVSLLIEPHNGKDRLRVRIQASLPNEKQERFLMPEPPLHGTIMVGGTLHDFGTELQEVSDKKTTAEIKRYLHQRAERRNRLLYARPEGVPKVGGDISGFLRSQQHLVFKHLGIFLLIYPYPQRQSLVQQTLLAFLKTLGLLKGQINIEES